MNIAFLSLGSNIGERKLYLEEAVQLLNQNPDINVLKVSSIYETKPVGYINQDDFLNIVVKVETSLEPLKLLNYCQVIEGKLNRIRNIRWGPRTIDLDILLYGQLKMESEILTIPHPRIKERAFVIVPLYELESDLKILDVSIKDIIKEIDISTVTKLDLQFCFI